MSKALPIPVLIKRIREEHALVMESARRTCEHAIRCGTLLGALRASTDHGRWVDFCKEQLGFPATTARRYIAVAEMAAAKRHRVRYLLNSGASLVDLYREFGLVKPVTPGGYNADVYQRRKAGGQIEFDFKYEEAEEHLAALVNAPNVERLGESTLRRLSRDLDAARERVGRILAGRATVDVEAEIVETEEVAP